MLPAGAAKGAAAIVAAVLLGSCSSDRAPTVAPEAAETRTTIEVSTSVPITTEALSAANQAAFEACAAVPGASQIGVDLQAALIHESSDREAARMDAAMATAVRFAQRSAVLDTKYQTLATAFAYWRDHGPVSAGEPEDPRVSERLLTELKLVDETCGALGASNADLITIPYAELSADTPERGRFDACEEIIFGRDGAVYHDGDRYTFDDCDRVTAEALEEPNFQTARRTALDLFAERAAEVVCWGEQCVTVREL